MNRPAVNRTAVNRTVTIAPVLKEIVVEATPQHAFEVFTAGIDGWWPKSHGIGATPLVRSVIEPFVGGRWYTRHEDGSDAVVGHVRVWEPAQRFVVSWEISPQWKPEARVELASEVEVRFVGEAAGRTRVVLEHRNFERMGAEGGESMRKGVDGGWPALLELFARAAAQGARLVSEFVLHTIPGSPFGRAALVVLEEKGGTVPGEARAARHAAAVPSTWRSILSDASRCSRAETSGSTRPRRSFATSTACCPRRR